MGLKSLIDITPEPPMHNAFWGVITLGVFN